MLRSLWVDFVHPPFYGRHLGKETWKCNFPCHRFDVRSVKSRNDTSFSICGRSAFSLSFGWYLQAMTSTVLSPGPCITWCYQAKWRTDSHQQQPDSWNRASVSNPEKPVTCVCVCVCEVSALTLPINLVGHIMANIMSSYYGGLAFDPGNGMQCFCPRASIQKLQQCFKMDITRSLFCYVAFEIFIEATLINSFSFWMTLHHWVGGFQTFRKQYNFSETSGNIHR